MLRDKLLQWKRSRVTTMPWYSIKPAPHVLQEKLRADAERTHAFFVVVGWFLLDATTPICYHIMCTIDLHAQFMWAISPMRFQCLYTYIYVYMLVMYIYIYIYEYVDDCRTTGATFFNHYTKRSPRVRDGLRYG